MKTTRLQLESALARGEMVTVCWEPSCSMHRLGKWGAQQWLPFEKSPTYRNYSHGVCPQHARLLQEEIDRFLHEQAPEAPRRFDVQFQPETERELAAA
ncbi:MAG: hypothetical protein IT369_24470 [Candidatus Latescibacteria bacterium]|nr:hypothetical protein [Candidatus Latescibacterota bacterium]